MEEAVKDGAGPRPRRTWRPTPATTSSSTPARPAPARTPTRRSPTPTSSSAAGSCQQRLIPAFMEPRSVVVQPLGRQLHDVVLHPDPAHPAGDAGDDHRHPRAQAAGHRPRRRRRLRRQAAGQPEEVLTLLVARRLGKPVKWTETRSESLMTAHHGRDQIQYIDIAADREGNVKGLRVRLLADMGAYLRLVTPGVPVLGAFMFSAIYKFPAYRFECDGVFTNKVPTDAYRGAGRPEATFAIERIMDELAVELDMDPLELRRKNWINAEEFPFTTVAGLAVRQRRLRDGDPAGAGADRLRRAARRAAAPPGVERPGAAGHRLLHVHRDVRAGPLAGARLAVLRRRRLGAGLDPDAAHRQGRGGHRLHARTGRATRRRGASSSPTSSACRSRTSRCCTATPRSPRAAWTPTARARWSSAAAAVVKAAREGGREGPQGRRAPARGQRGRPRLHRRDVLGAGHARHRAVASRRSPWRSSRRTTTRRASSPRSTPRRRSTR